MANKFQPGINFTSVTDFLLYLPPQELEIVNCLRDTIYNALPSVKESLSYNVPFFSIKKQFAYIWPASIPWGGNIKSGVSIGFTKGYLLDDELGFFNPTTKKVIRTKTYLTLAEIDIFILKDYLFRAAELAK